MTDHHCLTCAIRDAILNHFEEQGSLHGDAILVDARQVLDALVELAAETLSAVEDDRIRRLGLFRLARDVDARVTEIRATGEQPPIFRPS